MKNLVIITSVINPVDNPVKYDHKQKKLPFNRSIYSSSERFYQTLLTIESLKRIPNSFIVLLEGSSLSKEFSIPLFNLVDLYFNNFYNSKVSPLVNSYNKGNGEASMIIDFIKDFNLMEFSNIFKISGRYVLNNHFNFEEYDNDLNVFGLFRKKYLQTCFYKINKNSLNKYFMCLDDAQTNRKDIERVFRHHFINDDSSGMTKVIKTLGVTTNPSMSKRQFLI